MFLQDNAEHLAVIAVSSSHGKDETERLFLQTCDSALPSTYLKLGVSKIEEVDLLQADVAEQLFAVPDQRCKQTSHQCYLNSLQSMIQQATEQQPYGMPQSGRLVWAYCADHHTG